MRSVRFFVAVQFAYGVAVIGAFCVLMYLYWGWVGAVIYFVFACLCMIPAVLAAHKHIRNRGGVQ